MGGNQSTQTCTTGGSGTGGPTDYDPNAAECNAARMWISCLSATVQSSGEVFGNKLAIIVVLTAMCIILLAFDGCRRKQPAAVTAALQEKFSGAIADAEAALKKGPQPKKCCSPETTTEELQQDVADAKAKLVPAGLLKLNGARITLIAKTLWMFWGASSLFLTGEHTAPAPRLPPTLPTH